MKIFLALVRYSIYLFISLFVFVLILIYVFKWNPPRKFSNDEFSSSKESIEKGVFIADYELLNEIFIKDDSTYLSIKETWLQNSWYYNSWSKPVIKYGYIELMIIFDNESTFYLNGKRYSVEFGRGSSTFAHDNTFQGASITTESKYQADTLHVFITKYKYQENCYDTLSSFKLVKKK